MFVRYLLLGCFLIGVSCFGHGSHDPAETFEDLENLLAATFVELRKEADDPRPDPTKILFAGLDGHIYSVEKTAIAEALGRSIEMNLIKHCAESHCEHHCKQKSQGWRAWAWWILRALATPVTAPIMGAKEMALQLPPTLSELAGEFGVVPAVAVIIIWVPYTFVTEAIESAFLAHYHIACQLFQAVYWGPVSFVFLNLNSVKEAILARSPELNIVKKLYHIFRDRIKEWQFSRAIVKGFKLETKNPDVPLHPGGYVYPNFNATESMTKLYKFIDSQLEAAMGSGKIGYWKRVSARFQGGRLKALINSLRHARFIINHQTNRAQYEEWIKSSELAIQECLYVFWNMASGKATVEELSKTITQHADTVFAFRKGTCALSVAIPGVEEVFQLGAPGSDIASAAIADIK